MQRIKKGLGIVMIAAQIMACIAGTVMIFSETQPARTILWICLGLWFLSLLGLYFSDRKG